MTSASSPAPPSDLARRARRALIVVPVVMAVALLIAVTTTYIQVKAVLATAARGQGEAWLQELRYLTRPESDWNESSLNTLLDVHRPAGLLCVAARSDTGLVVAGTCLTPESEIEALLHGGPWQSATNIGTVTRIIGHSPDAGRRRRPEPRPGPRPDPLDPRFDRPARPFRPDRPPRDGAPPPFADEERSRPGVRHPVPAVYLELEPVATRDLAAGARRTLGIGVGASLALVIAALAYRSLARRDEAARRENERESRLASLGEMSAVLAHEIRNPLASMKGHAQLLAEQLPEGSRERGKADRVVHEAVRLERLTADLLSFVRTQRIDRRDVDPGTLLRDSCAHVEGPSTELRAGHPIEVEVGSAPSSWSLDPERIGEVLQNLLRNAVQACPEKAAVTARVTRVAGALRYTVRDRGPGIPLGQEDKIFEPFHTTRARGTGLGLAIARRIVELHGGTITAANHPEGGAVFTVTLPMKKDE